MKPGAAPRGVALLFNWQVSSIGQLGRVRWAYSATQRRGDWACLRQSLKHVILPSLTPLLLRLVDSFHAQVSPTAACNGRHKAEHRLGRRLLMIHDRISGGSYPMKHEFPSTMLGGVTITAQARLSPTTRCSRRRGVLLQQATLILVPEYGRRANPHRVGPW